MTATAPSPSDDAIRFPSLESLRAAHTELLKEFRVGAGTPEMISKVEAFILRGRATGALLDAVSDRWSAQSQLDYWATQIYQPGYEPPDATLEEFDPQLAPELDNSLCPYVGLDAFRESNESIFFGRGRLVSELISKLNTTRFLAVLGSSGSGKSSVVRAGLLPALKNGALPSSADWKYFSPMVPGSNPLINLARLMMPPEENAAQAEVEAGAYRDNPAYLAQIVSERFSNNVVLVVDQFEEIFTLCIDEEIRQRFVENLIALSQAPKAEHRVIITMRSDYETNIARLPELQDMFEQNAVRITPLTASELRESIEAPAARIGLKFEEGVVNALLNDILGEPAALPLLQFTLLKLWEKRERNRVTWEAYKKLGGGRQALARSADEFYNQLIPEEQVTMRRILLKMVKADEGLEMTSQRVPRAALYQKAEANDRIDRVLGRLIKARLVRVSEGDMATDDQVEVAHEALLRNWPRLVEWLEEERVALRQRQRLTAAAEAWQRLNRDPTALWRGVLLEEVRRYDDLSNLETEFVEASYEAEKAELRKLEERAAQLRRRSYYLTAALAVALVAVWAAINFGNEAQRNANEAAKQLTNAENEKIVAIYQRATAQAASTLAVEQRDIARDQAVIARSGELATTARTYLDDHLDLSLLLSVEAFSRSNNYSSRNMLLTSLQSNSRLISFLAVPKGIPESPTFSAFGKMLASGRCVRENESGSCMRGEVLLWDVTDPAAPLQIGKSPTGHHSDVSSLSISPNGKTLASGSCAKKDESGFCTQGEILLWDISHPEAELQSSALLSGHADYVSSLTFSMDGKTLASGSCTRKDAMGFCKEGEVLLWDITDPAEPQQMGKPLSGYKDYVWSLAFNPKRQILASGSCGNHETKQDNSVKCTQGEILLWDIANPTAPKQIGAPLSSQTDHVFSLAYSQDGNTLASGSADRTIRMWDVADPLSPNPIGDPLIGHSEAVISVAFNPDGQTLTTISCGKQSGTDYCTQSEALLWDISNPAANLPIGKPLIGKINASVNSVVFNPDRSILASGHKGGAVVLWDVSNPIAPQPIGEPLVGNHSAVWALAFSPDGNILASGSCATSASDACMQGEVLLWDVTNPKAPVQISGPLMGNHSFVWGVSFSSDGNILASGGCGKNESGTCTQGEVLLWDVTNPKAPVQIGEPFAEEHPEVENIAFNPAGSIIAAVDSDGTIILWDVSDPAVPEQIGEPLTGHTGSVWSVAFSPDGNILASASADNTIILWEVSNPTNPVRLTVLTGHTNEIFSVAFDKAGTHLASGGLDNTIILWDLNPSSWVEKACQRAGRNLTLAEWKQYFPEEEYHATCEQWPSEPEIVAIQ